MNEALAHERLVGVLTVIDEWGALYERRWGYGDGHRDQPGMAASVNAGKDVVQARVRLAHDVIAAMGLSDLAADVIEHEEGAYMGHPYQQARAAIVEAIAILSQREELAEIVGPVGPRLAASELHPIIWGSAANLWDDGHHRAAVQTAATAFEGLLQDRAAGPAVSGANLANVFSTQDPTPGSPRLRLRDIDPKSSTWKSAHEGAAALIRGAFMGVRNLVSHPGWDDPSPDEALEMVAVLSYVARLVDRSDRVEAR